MELLVEAGAGLADANSYLSVEQADAYHLARGNRRWNAAGPDDKQAALIRATQYLDVAYRFAGAPSRPTQALAWPRDGALVVPALVLSAAAELALRALDGPLLPDTTGTATTGGQVIQETVGPITVKYASGSAPKTASVARFPYIDLLLAPLAQPVNGADAKPARMVPLVRV